MAVQNHFTSTPLDMIDLFSLRRAYSVLIKPLCRQVGLEMSLLLIYRYLNYKIYGDRFRGHGESEVLNEFIDFCQPSDLVFDIGAARGDYTYWPAVLSGCSVVAFEPDEALLQDLRRKQEYVRDRVLIMPMGLWSESGTISFNPTGKGTGSVSVGDDEIEVITGKDAIEECGSPTVLKIDVEGAELEVLHGFADALDPGEIRGIFCEVHQPSDELPDITDLGSEPSEVDELLRDKGYQVEVIHSRERDYHIKAVR